MLSRALSSSELSRSEQWLFLSDVSGESNGTNSEDPTRPETSVRNYHYWLRNDPEERSSHVPHGGSLKSGRLLFHLKYRFPTIFHLRTPWQPIYINCTFSISEMFVINIVAVISNLYVVTVNYNCLCM